MQKSTEREKLVRRGELGKYKGGGIGQRGGKEEEGKERGFSYHVVEIGPGSARGAHRLEVALDGRASVHA